jgi:hypothetical protein
MTHRDDDQWWKSLQEKAVEMERLKKSTITAGKPEETPIAGWKRNGVSVTQLPDDEHGILRISIGGGSDLPREINYCTFRGEHGKCIELLRKALKALEDGPLE